MRLSILSSLALLLSAVACGPPDVCDHAATVFKDVTTRAALCSNASVSGVSLTIDTATCKRDEPNCSASDKTTLNGYLDCLEAVKAPTCVATDSENAKSTQFTTYSLAVEACGQSSSLNSLSGPCQTAFASEASAR